MPDKSIADLVGFADATPERSTYRPPAERILSGDPVQTAQNYYTDPTGRFSAGIWECARIFPPVIRAPRWRPGLRTLPAAGCTASWPRKRPIRR